MRKTAVVGLVLLTASVGAADWPQWRGPARDGRATLAPRPSLPETLTPAWKVAVGEGHASPVVVGDRVYVFSREGEEEEVQALELATGCGKEHLPELGAGQCRNIRHPRDLLLDAGLRVSRGRKILV